MSPVCGAAGLAPEITPSSKSGSACQIRTRRAAGGDSDGDVESAPSTTCGGRRRVDVLVQTAAFDDGSTGAVPDADVLLTVADVVAQRRPLAIRYASSPAGVVRRGLHPKDLVAYAGQWYLTAYEAEAEGDRTFRIDARQLPGVLAPRERRDAAEVVSELIDGFARSERPWSIVLRVQAGEDAIRAHLPASVAAIDPLPRSGAEPLWHRVEIHAERLDWLASVIVSLGCPVRVDTPAEPRTLLVDASVRLHSAARVDEF